MHKSISNNTDLQEQDEPREVRVQYFKCPFNNEGKEARTYVLPEEDRIVSHSIRTMRWWDFLFASQIFQKSMRGDESGVFFDVGANIGTTSLLAADVFSKIHGFELEPRNAVIFRHAMEMNNINFELHECAVSDSAGRAQAFRSKDNMGGHSLEAISGAHDASFTVQTITLDDFDQSVRNVKFLHIDTEGHDLRVLRGARKFLARQHHLPFIELEFSPRTLTLHGTSVLDLLSIMDEFGYNAYMNAANALGPLSRLALAEMFREWSICDAWIDIYLIPSK